MVVATLGSAGHRVASGAAHRQLADHTTLDRCPVVSSIITDLLAVDLALRSLADGVAHGGAHRVVALPAALRVAVAAGLGDGRHEVGLGAHSQCEGGQQHEQQGGAHGAEG